MSEEQQARLEELWAKCCDLSQAMSGPEFNELMQLLELETQELEHVEG